MKSEYEAYLAELIAQERERVVNQSSLSDTDILRYKCQKFAQAFADRFPELQMQSGFYAHTEHWWCVDEHGAVVDPTKAQFGNQSGPYTVFDPAKHQVRIGKCMNCGADIYGLVAQGRRVICDDECRQDYEDYLNAELKKHRTGETWNTPTVKYSRQSRV